MQPWCVLVTSLSLNFVICKMDWYHLLLQLFGELREIIALDAGSHSPSLQISIAPGVGKSKAAHQGPHRVLFLDSEWVLQGPLLKWVQLSLGRVLYFPGGELCGQS